MNAAQPLHQPLHQILYVSRLAPGFDATVVPRILQVSRLHNAAHDISGLLVFDGEMFCQWLEGPAGHVLPLMGRILEDERHTEVDVLHEGAGQARQFSGFAMGYALAEDDAPLRALATRRGQAALQALLALAPQLDTAP